MGCNIMAHFNGAKAKGSGVVGVAYRVFRNSKVLCQGRNAFIGMTPETRKYASLSELLKSIVAELEQGNIPKGSSITFVGDNEVLISIQTKTYPKGIMKNVLKDIKVNLAKLETSLCFKYKERDLDLSYCGTKTPQYLSKVAYLSVLELLKFRGDIKDVNELLNIIDLKEQLGIISHLNFETIQTKAKCDKVLKRKDFLRNNITISSHCFDQWNDRVSSIGTKRDILKFVFASALIDGGITHEYEDFYCLQGDIICVVILEGNQIHFTTTYGTISKTPALSQTSYLKQIICKYGRLNLSLT